MILVLYFSLRTRQFQLARTNKKPGTLAGVKKARNGNCNPQAKALVPARSMINA
jgi:hypothetical protein